MANSHQSDTGGSAGFAAKTLTSSSAVRRDLAWLQQASADDIDRALERGDLDRLLGPR